MSRWVGLIWLVIFAIAFAIYTAGEVEARDLVELHSVDVDFIHFFPGGHNPLITQNGLPNRQLGAQLDLHVDIDLLRYFFWDSTVHSMTDKRIDPNDAADQFRTINLQMQLGVRLSSKFNVYYWHSSEHLLDTVYANGHWPVQDGVGLTFKIYEAPVKRETLLP